LELIGLLARIDQGRIVKKVFLRVNWREAEEREDLD
jgi:hypothetical protein